MYLAIFFAIMYCNDRSFKVRLNYNLSKTLSKTWAAAQRFYPAGHVFYAAVPT